MIPRNLAERIRILRLRLGCAHHQELANTTGISRPTISKLERGDNNPTLDVLRKLSEAFGVRISFLIGDTNSDCDIEEAISKEALAMFLKNHIVPEGLELRLRKLAKRRAGPPTPDGWKELAHEISPDEQIIKRFPRVSRKI